MATVADRLVGRADEIGTVERALARLGERESVAMAFLGEPGIGKTRMLGELDARAGTPGHIVLSGSASELESDLPFWVFVDALDDYVAALEPRRLDSLDDALKAELGQLFPSLAEFARSGELPSQDERYRIHRAVSELLERIAATKPLVLLLDDIHWADSASIDLLAALLRRPPAAPVLFAMAARPRQVPPRLGKALDRAARSGAVTRVELGALAPNEAAEMLGGAVDTALADTIYREGGGNPFYLEQLARAAERRGSLTAAGSNMALDGVEVPAAVASALNEELALLAEPARRVLEGAAVAGDPFDPDLAAAAAATDDVTATEALDHLLGADLIRRTDVPRRFRFRHPLVRTVVYATAPGGWVLGAHERCSEALAARGASAVARAHHVEHAARPGDTDAVQLLSEAAGTVMTRAPASSARWFGGAVRLLPDDAEPEQRLGLLMARAGALAQSGQLEESRTALLETLRLVPEDAVESWVQLTVACANVEHFLGRHDIAQRRLAEALERLRKPESPEGVELMLELAVDSMFHADYAAAQRWATRALAAARSLGDRVLIATAGAMAMLGAACTGEIEPAERLRGEITALVDAMPDDELARRPDTAGYLAAAEVQLDRFADGIEHAERGLEIARATGRVAPTIVPTLGTARFMRGLLEDAVAVLDVGLETARVAGVEQAIAWSLVNRSMAALASGDVETARSTADEAIELTQQLDESFISGWAGVAHAGALLATGEPERAAETLMAESGGEALGRIPAGWKPMALELLTRCRLAHGDVDAALSAADGAAAISAAVPLPMARAWAERAAAEVALASGDAAAAANAALSAAQLADEAGAVIEAALSRVLAGRAQAAAGDRAAAVAELERAAAAFDACGAVRHRDAAERELRKLGRPAYRRTRKGTARSAALADLSERELEVARLVVNRRTNKEIAGELFVSLKTVEAHMRNLFRKLGVSSRAEVARTIERAERDPGRA